MPLGNVGAYLKAPVTSRTSHQYGSEGLKGAFNWAPIYDKNITSPSVSLGFLLHVHIERKTFWILLSQTKFGLYCLYQMEFRFMLYQSKKCKLTYLTYWSLASVSSDINASQAFKMIPVSSFHLSLSWAIKHMPSRCSNHFNLIIKSENTSQIWFNLTKFRKDSSAQNKYLQRSFPPQCRGEMKLRP